jgi:DNA-binding transcriptional LysR family regulator
MEPSGVMKGNIGELDLNLLRPLHALLEQGGVSRAADVLGTSQPVISRFLARLRQHLGDPLLVRAGSGMRLTEKAESLRVPVRVAVSQLDAIFADNSAFDPRVITKPYRITAAECHQLVFLPALFGLLRAQSTSLRLVVETPGPNDLERLICANLDFLIGPATKVHESLRMRRIATESFCCVVSPKHPLICGPIGEDLYCRLQHAALGSGTADDTGCIVDETLKSHKLDRKVVLRASSFLAMTEVLLHSDLVATVPRRYGQVAEKLGLRVVEAPEILREQQLCLLWHSSRQSDAGHAWLRGEVVKLAMASEVLALAAEEPQRRNLRPPGT